MTQPQINDLASQLAPLLSGPLSATFQFWLFLILSFLSLVVTYLGLRYAKWAYKEAGDAKDAARQAVTATKTHMDTTALTQTSQKFQELRPEMSFETARSLLAEISRSILRIASYLEHEPNTPSVKNTITCLRESINAAKAALQGVKPADSRKEKDAPRAVFNALEGPFMEIDALVCVLCGQLDAKTLPSAAGGNGEYNASA